ncbi:hypothetical protein [Dactylosporangium sp. CA-092794]|uniref:hypothetical protein n=1 Tax=Dactylosporangium sp. CA-092794 TaxID=3239929 RepID=UPI003D8F5C15
MRTRILLAPAVLATALIATPGTASASDASPCSRTQFTVYSIFKVQYCPLWTGNVPVYDISAVWTGGNQAPVGYLTYGGWANWFNGQAEFGEYGLNGYQNRWWAFTQADNGAWGWVPEVYFSGGGNDEPDSGLYQCAAAGNWCTLP